MVNVNFVGRLGGDSEIKESNGKQFIVMRVAVDDYNFSTKEKTTQWINVKLMPQQNTEGNDQANSMAQSMKTMNMLMPIMSAWFCFTLPSGLGLYWVAGSVVRSIQQVITNKYIDKLDFDEIIEKNKEKAAKKMEKQGQRLEKMQE